MATDSERLQILIEGKVNDFEKSIKSVERKIDRIGRAGNDNMRRVQSASSRAARTMERDFTRANSKVVAGFQKLGGAAKGGLAALGVSIAGLGAAAVVRGVSRTASAVAALGDQADKVGVTVEQLQALRLEFGKSGVAQRAVDMGLQRFSRRVAEAAQGTGELYQTIVALNIPLTNVDGTLRPIVDIFADYAQAIQDAESQQEALRLAFKAFDSEGAGMVNLLRQVGSEAKNVANSLNGDVNVFNSDDVRRAREIDAAFADLSRKVETFFKKIGLGLGGPLVALAEEVGEVVDQVAKLVQGATEADTALGKMIQAITTRSELPEGARYLSESEREAARLASEIAVVESEIKDLNKELSTTAQRLGDAQKLGNEPQLERLQTDLVDINAQLNKAVDRLVMLRDVGAQVQINTPFPNGAPPGIGPTGSVGTITNAGHYIGSRAAHGNVSTAGLTQAAAAGAAAVLQQFDGLQVSSAYRSPEYNRRIGGAPNSRHTHGDAVDFVGADEAKLAAIVRALQMQGFRGFGYYGDGKLHADMGARRAWGPDRTSGSLGQTPLAFQRAVMAGPQMSPEFSHQLYQRDVASSDAARDKAEQERLELLRQQNAERERQQAAITAVNESLTQQLELAGLENELLSSGRFTLEEVNAALDQEQLVREKLNQLKAAGVEVTPRMEAAIRSEAAAVYELINANEQLVNSQDRINDKTAEMAQAFEAVGQPIVDTFLSILDGSAKAEDAIKSLIKQLAKMLIQGALFGSGPLGKLFGGGLIGGFLGGGAPGRAIGGPVSGGSPYVVGERGPELFVPNVGGRIIPRLSDAMPAAGAGGGAGRIEIVSRFDADGGFVSAVEKASQPVAMRESRAAVKTGLTQYDREMQGAPLLGRIDRAREKY